jgi:hypothetical protein
MLTERFYQLRKKELDIIFSKKNISKIWRKVVKNQLRKLADILDIFDYYDFNYNIDERAILLRKNLLNGDYQSSPPLIYRVEKKFGICRHVIIPQPVDAIVLHVITEKIFREIIDRQPSPNAFYSRDKHNIKKPHEIDEYGFNWRELFKKMQKQIYKFKDEKEFLVTTDLTNYYDSINISELRKKITNFVNDKEVLIDILFMIIEKISWLPDYLPYSGRGLPTTNFEGIRLLAHSFLFELDLILKNKTNNSFTRWMDDIVIGVSSREEAIEILSQMSDLLKSRGLALNLSKTDIFDSKDAEFNFLINENKYIDAVDYGESKPKLEKELKKNFKKHLRLNYEAKYFEKITKRYITTLGKIKSEILLPDIPELYIANPGIRQNLLIYLSTLGYKKKTSNVIVEILDKINLFDDVSLFNICKLITDWNVKSDKTGDKFLNEISQRLLSFSQKRKIPFDFYCILWFKTKYEKPEELYEFIEKYENIWKIEPFLRRQVTAIMARLFFIKKEKRVKFFLEKQIATGEQNVVSIANHILYCSSINKIEEKVLMYLFPSNVTSSYYQLPRFLVLCSFLNSAIYRDDNKVKLKIKDYIKDSYMLKWLKLQYNIR